MSGRILIGPCPVDCLAMEETVKRLRQAVIEHRRISVAPVNAATVVDAAGNAPLRAALDEMDLLLPDGYWLQMAARFLPYPSPGHVATVPLTFELLRGIAPNHGRVYVLGAQDDIGRKAADEIARRFPGIEIGGTHDGYFAESEEPGIVQEVNGAGVDILLIGISSPKRELFMARWRHALNPPVIMGVGGLIDILGGKTPEGPQYLRDCGMMWLYRLLQEPRRLWKRYTIVNTQFALLVIQQAMRIWLQREADKTNQ